MPAAKHVLHPPPLRDGHVDERQREDHCHARRRGLAGRKLDPARKYQVDHKEYKACSIISGASTAPRLAACVLGLLQRLSCIWSLWAVHKEAPAEVCKARGAVHPQQDIHVQSKS